MKFLPPTFCIYLSYISCYTRSIDFYLTHVFRFSWQGLLRWRSLGFLYETKSMIRYSDAYAVSIYRMTEFGSGVGWSDCEEEMCQLYRKGEQTVGHQRYTKGLGQYEPKGQHFMWKLVMNSNILLPTNSLCNYFIFSGHRIPELANSVPPVFCQAIPVRIQTALTCHLNNRHINFFQPQHNNI